MIKRNLNQAAYDALLNGAKLLQADPAGPKVYALSNGQILKLFRVRRFWSSNLWSPYAKRFALNGTALKARGFRTITVEAWGHVPHLKRQYARYDRLPGEMLRKSTGWSVEQLANFLAELHDKGVLFRSCHLGNLLLQEDGGIALIDIMDLKIFDRPLTESERERNFRHVTRAKRDRKRFETLREPLKKAYLEARATHGKP